MPTYYSRLTTVQLAVADLRKTTTSKPKTRPHPSVYEEINACATEFAKASVNGTLDENPIHTEDEKHSHVRYLGTSGNMPFFIVQAGKAFFEPETEGKRTRRPARVPHSAMNTASMSQISSLIEPYVITRKCKAEGAYEPVQGEDEYERILRQIRPPPTAPPPLVPYALFLSVYLSRASFIPTYVKNSKKTLFHDVKIDVYFAGELCASNYVSDRFHSDKHGMTEHIVRFSGRRVHHLLEKPWIMLPPGQDPNGRPRPERQNTGLPGGAKERWDAVSKALMIEAGKLDRGKYGELSVLGDYLSTLAKLEMPSEVEGMQTAGGPKMGIIDVIITAGIGHKDDANSLRLMEPTPIRLNEPESSAPEDGGKNEGKRPVKKTSVAEDANAQGEATPNMKGIVSSDASLTRDFDVGTEESATISEPLAFTANSTPDNLITRFKKTRFSLTSRADNEILAQRSTVLPESLRSQNRVVSDPVTNEPQIQRRHTLRGPSIGSRLLGSLRATITHSDPASPRTNSDTPVTPSPIGAMNLRRLRSLSINPSSDVTRPRLLQNQTTSPSAASAGRVTRHRTSQGTFTRAPAPTSPPSPLPPPPSKAQKRYQGDTASAEPPPPIKRRGNYEMVLDNKLTLAEEMEAIAAKAAAEMLNPPSEVDANNSAKGKGRSSDRIRKAGANQVTPKEEEKTNESIKSKLLKLKISGPKPPPQPLKSLPQTPGFLQDPAPSSPYSLPQTATPQPSSEPGSATPITPQSNSRPRRQWAPFPNPPHRAVVGAPSLNNNTNEDDDSVLTYAPGYLLRQVKGERNGWFKEDSVVMGVRFLVG